MYRFEAVFGRFGPFWIVWERFGHPGLPNQTSKSQIRQPYFREPPLPSVESGVLYHRGLLSSTKSISEIETISEIDQHDDDNDDDDDSNNTKKSPTGVPGRGAGRA